MAKGGIILSGKHAVSWKTIGRRYRH